MRGNKLIKKNQETLNILTVIFIVTLVISNVLTGKIIDTGFTLFGKPVTIAGAVICYPITYLITDIVGEIWGKKEANKIVKYGLIGQLIATFLIVVTTYTPYVDIEMQQAYVKLLGQNWIFVLGSLLAYLASQHLDVVLFHNIRDKYIAKYGSTKGGRWIWNNASTITSQLFDTVIFITISFGIGFGWLWNDLETLINMIIGQYVIKFIIALCDTPFFYLCTTNVKK